MLWACYVPIPPEDLLGLIPTFFADDDPRPALEQLNEGYGPVNGGPVRPSQGFTLFRAHEPGYAWLSYPDDPPLHERARAVLHNGSPTPESLILFDAEILAIVQADGSFVAARVD